ncbi:MAG: metallophosphoesterase [Deltaproteobacteria bacterium]|nr:metallophosphoesterase [Deltaproteobacteria bacterium]
MRLIIKLFMFALLAAALTFAGCSDSGFRSDVAEDIAKPWTDKKLEEAGEGMVFAVFGDRTGLHYPGKLSIAVEKINRSNPDFVVSVGDHIEGYTRDVEALDQEWAEFDALIDKLDSRFFKIPGNHDYSNHVMAEYYKNLYGRDYYYFVFNNVLFLCLNTQDPPSEKPEEEEKKMSGWMHSMVESVKHDSQKGIATVQETLKKYSGAHGHATISDAQVEYFRGVIDRHKDVKWTLVFMHMPAWDGSYQCENFKNLQQALKGRAYTVFAGHEHQYRLETVNGNAYYRVGPTAAIPRENIPECERQFLIVDFRGATPKVQVVKVEDKVL